MSLEGSSLAFWLAEQEKRPRDENERAWIHLVNTKIESVINVFKHLDKSQTWVVNRLYQVLRIWSSEDLFTKSFLSVSRFLGNASDETLYRITSALVDWLQQAQIKGNDYDNVVRICHRILLVNKHNTSEYSLEIDDDYLLAINHPLGKISKILFEIFCQTKSIDNKLLHISVKNIFSIITEAP